MSLNETPPPMKIFCVRHWWA